MPAFVVAYDLKKVGQNYTCIADKLDAYPTHWHMQGSVWIIASDKTAAQIRDDLRACLDTNDECFVGSLGGEAAWCGYSDDISRWLKEQL